MHSQNLILLLATAVTAVRGLQQSDFSTLDNGVYIHSVDDTGNHTMTYKGSLPLGNGAKLRRDSAGLINSAKFRRDAPDPSGSSTWTGCDSTIFADSDWADIITAQATLTAECANDNPAVIQGSTNLVVKINNIASYVCNWGGENNAYASQANEAWTALASACNRKAGMYQWNSWKKGIGYAPVGGPWCNGVGGPVSPTA